MRVVEEVLLEELRAFQLKEGWTPLNKFGAGTGQTTLRAIYCNMAVTEYPFKFTNSAMTIVSTNALDVGQTIEISYTEVVGSTWVHKTTTAVLNGLTPVTIQKDGVNANIMMPWRLVNKGIGGVSNTGGLVGNVTVNVGATNYCGIIDGDNQSLIAIYHVPTGYKLIIHGVGRSVVGVNKEAEFHYKAIPFGEPSQTKRVTYLANGSDYEDFPVPFVFPPKTVVYVAAKINSGSALCSAWFDGYLVQDGFI